MSNAHVLDDVHTFLGRFIAYPSPEAQVAHTLWIAHTHLMDKWAITPRLAILSAEKRSGKTRVLEITTLLTPNAVHVGSASVSAIFRSIDAGKKENKLPTLLYDEIDTVFTSKPKEGTEDLRGLLNEGYRSKGTVLRNIFKGNEYEPKPFSCYCAVALSGIGDLPDTILDRSVIIRLKRRKASEPIEQYRERVHEPEGHALRERLATWAESVKDRVGNPWPEIPPEITDRAADIWEPLLAVADAAGGKWPSDARCFAVSLVSEGREVARSRKERLLADIKSIFDEEKTDKIFSKDLVDSLINKEESEWSNPKYLLSDNSLARSLKQYSIHPKQIRIGNTTKKGYELKDFIDAWERHIPSLPSLSQGGETGETTETDLSEEDPISEENNCSDQEDIADETLELEELQTMPKTDDLSKLNTEDLEKLVEKQPQNIDEGWIPFWGAKDELAKRQRKAA